MLVPSYPLLHPDKAASRLFSRLLGDFHQLRHIFRFHPAVEYLSGVYHHNGSILAKARNNRFKNTNDVLQVVFLDLVPESGAVLAFCRHAGCSGADHYLGQADTVTMTQSLPD